LPADLVRSPEILAALGMVNPPDLLHLPISIKGEVDFSPERLVPSLASIQRPPTAVVEDVDAMVRFEFVTKSSEVGVVGPVLVAHTKDLLALASPQTDRR
jgi:hypothetical protein